MTTPAGPGDPGAGAARPSGAMPGARACPSHVAEPGTLVIGMADGTGRVGIFGRPLPADQDFIDRAGRNGPPESRFRFAGTYVEAQCRQWTGSQCGVIARVIEALGPLPAAPLPPCGIRAACRWFSDRGGAACQACPLVVTDGMGPRPDAPA